MESFLETINTELLANFEPHERRYFDFLKDQYIAVLSKYKNRQELILDEELSVAKRLEICQQLSALQDRILKYVKKKHPRIIQI